MRFREPPNRDARVSCRWGSGGLPQENFYNFNASRCHFLQSEDGNCHDILPKMFEGFGHFYKRSGLRLFGLWFTEMARSADSFSKDAQDLPNFQWREAPKNFEVLKGLIRINCESLYWKKYQVFFNNPKFYMKNPHFFPCKPTFSKFSQIPVFSVKLPNPSFSNKSAQENHKTFQDLGYRGWIPPL